VQISADNGTFSEFRAGLAEKNGIKLRLVARLTKTPSIRSPNIIQNPEPSYNRQNRPILKQFLLILLS
jgi:hypothetical protein